MQVGGDRSFLVSMAKPAKKPATFVAKGVTALGRSQTYKRSAPLAASLGMGYWRPQPPMPPLSAITHICVHGESMREAAGLICAVIGA